MEVRRWPLSRSRDFEGVSGEGSGNTDPSDLHFRAAESQFLRTAPPGQYEIVRVEYVCNPALADRFERKRRDYDARFNGNHTKLLAFHGTSLKNVDGILKNGFKLSKVGSTTDAGFFGAGTYFSEHASMSIAYCRGSSQMLLCRLLLGKPYLMKTMKTGCKLASGYTSHMSSKDGQEVVMFDEAASLPVYIVHFKPRRQQWSGGGGGGGDGLAGLGSGGPGPEGADDIMGGMMGGAMGGMLGGMMAALGTGVTMFAPPPTNAGGPGSAPYHSAFEGEGRTLGGR